jgi:hypothetical protein
MDYKLKIDTDEKSEQGYNAGRTMLEVRLDEAQFAIVRFAILRALERAASSPTEVEKKSAK